MEVAHLPAKSHLIILFITEKNMLAYECTVKLTVIFGVIPL